MHSDRLQRIIELKEKLMEEKELLLDHHRRESERIASHIRNLSDEIEVNYADICSRCLDGSEFASIKDYLDHLDRTKTDALEQKDSVERQILIIRGELYEMLKDIKMLESLEKKRISAAKRAANKKDQKLLDQIALRLQTPKT